MCGWGTCGRVPGAGGWCTDIFSGVDLSVVVPVFNERDALPELHARLTGVLSSLVSSYEIVLVNDASTDDSWSIILSLASSDRHTKAIGLSRNFGHQLAITAGLDVAQGDAEIGRAHV